MNNIEFDKPRLNEMQDFLTYLYTIGIQNDMFLNKHIVYREISKYGLNKSNLASNGDLIDNENLFYEWIDRNKKHQSYSKGLTVYRDPSWEYFLQFFSNDSYDELISKKEYIKLYIPIDYNYLYEGVNQLFDYITDSKINHISKVSKKVRNDNVIVRLDKNDSESASKIIDYISNDYISNNNFIKNDSKSANKIIDYISNDYISNNNFIKSGLNKVNPFVPTINGIGFMYETGISYNMEMSELISSYINRNIKAKTEPNLQGFYDFFKVNNKKNDVKNTFETALGINVKKEERFDKKAIFFAALRATYLKYGIEQTITALNEAIQNNNFSYFTNRQYRQILQNNLAKEEILDYIRPYLNSNNITSDSLYELCYRIFANDLNYQFDEACLITLSNYGVDHLYTAINKIIYENNPGYFSRFSNNKNDQTNYRNIIISLGPQGVLNMIKTSIKLSQIDINNMDTTELIKTYCSNLNNLNINNNMKR